MFLADIANRRLQYRPTAIKQRGKGHHHACPLQKRSIARLDITRARPVKRGLQHHHLHHGQPGNKKAAPLTALDHLQTLLACGGIKWQCPVTERAQPSQNRRETGLLVIPLHQGLLLGVIDLHTTHALGCRQSALEQPYAGTTSHAVDHQTGLQLLAVLRIVDPLNKAAPLSEPLNIKLKR